MGWRTCLNPCSALSSPRYTVLLPAPGYTNHTLINNGFRCECTVPVDLTEEFNMEDTYLYYELEEFYQVRGEHLLHTTVGMARTSANQNQPPFNQNHRAYIKSRWDAQLRSVTAKGNVECDPLNTDANGKTYAPCGLVANSLFNGMLHCPRLQNVALICGKRPHDATCERLRPPLISIFPLVLSLICFHLFPSQTQFALCAA